MDGMRRAEKTSAKASDKQRNTSDGTVGLITKGGAEATISKMRRVTD